MKCECCGDEGPTVEVRDCGCAFCDCCFEPGDDDHVLAHGLDCIHHAPESQGAS